MSRIEEALRRSERVPFARSGDKQDLFVSAWAIEEPAPAAAPAPEPTRIASGPESAVLETSPITLSSAWRDQLATSPTADPVLVEQFRRLAATLHNAQTSNGIRVIMLTSASPDDGKTLTALNLALVLSESYRKKVLLIDADLRRPSLGNIADVTNVAGLSEALRSTTDKKLGILQITPTLMLLPAGRPDPDPMGGLTSARMRHIVEEAAARFDWVILDAPPMAPMADASLLARMVHGSVFVIRSGRSQHPAVQKAIEALGRDSILGVVLNGVETVPAESYAYYGRTNKGQP